MFYHIMSINTMSARDTAIQKNIYGLGATTLVVSNKEIEDIIKTIISLEESILLIKRSW